LRPFKLASREFKPDDTVVRVSDDVEVGGNWIVVMAGPCAVENERDLIETAFAVKASGAQVLRGGAFKPRTSPYSFQGLGKDGLRLLAKARDASGLSVVTEVLSPDDVDLVSAFSDILQVGARNMQNFSLLHAVGESKKPVLLKRGMSATVEEWLMAAEYVLAGGNTQVILCERGIRTFETYTRNTMDVSSIPLVKQLSHLPVIADPSHGTGLRSLVPALARAAVAAGSDGLLVEVHPNPEKALSDGPQSLTLDEFRALMRDVSHVAGAVGRTTAVPAAPSTAR
jgi:3-deoxy-7-phosphoheptulonate synthase